MGSVSSVGGGSNIPQPQPQESSKDQDQLQAIGTFSTMVQDLATLLAEAKEGGKSHG